MEMSSKFHFFHVCEKYEQESWLNIDKVVMLISCNIEQNIRYQIQKAWNHFLSNQNNRPNPIGVCRGGFSVLCALCYVKGVGCTVCRWQAKEAQREFHMLLEDGCHLPAWLCTEHLALPAVLQWSKHAPRPVPGPGSGDLDLDLDQPVPQYLAYALKHDDQHGEYHQL